MVRPFFGARLMKSVSYTTLAPPPKKYSTINISAEVESVGTTHAHNALLRRWHVGVHAFIYVVEFGFSARFRQITGLETRWRKKGVERHLRRRIMGLEGRRRKKAVNRRLRRQRVLHMGHPYVANLMVEIGGLEGRRRKKAVNRRLHRRCVLHMHLPSAADLMFEGLQRGKFS
ncbi:LOW QUALITY PROTEIN: hypothetical protein Cgig2_000133 [Carnegiea gigantea]|uniref:Uncharacterized protein n=1 Tax=Carnegiea gigantea TaxID=171969 RepID=A0A9Q1L124_9CARY|nr:LOW QUALITY PROTEIN: hypothetical protein Cgig2_000133 [Carnegiea gigantea]